MEQEQQAGIVEYIQEVNGQLEETGQSSANRAFNLGCWFGLVPAGLLALLIFILSEGSGVVTFVSGTMIMVSLVALANLAAYIAKSKTISRQFDEQIEAQIEEKLDEFGLTRREFNQIVVDNLPQGTAMRKLAAPEE